MNDQERARLQEKYPNWHIRRPPTMKCLVATRLDRPLTQREIYYGLSATLVEDTYDLLSQALAGQRKIEETL
ncbi:hypothetical protein LUW74_46165 [Actinomadura madurae]|uniref:hypothetical protein n=1 Tax=Actinomadura madurae TaxID=1993 RepID=UPI00202735D3|nr:hypothetical protein [Actinomadura madurae]URN10019.1 hypothetical protein LUW74_46165 [Actinomadura madurae]